MKVNYTKLRSGDWGIRVETEGQEAMPNGKTAITVTKKDGSTRRETIDAIVWQKDRVALCTIIQRPRRYECEECGEWVTSGDGTHCWETGMAH